MVFLLTDNKRGRIMVFRRGNYSFLLVKPIMYMERQSTWVCMWVCVCLFYGNTLQGTQIPPKTLYHLFLLFVPRRHMRYSSSNSGKEPEEQRGEGGGTQGHTAGSWTSQPTWTSPACSFLLPDPPASRLIKPCSALLYINLKLGLLRGILAFSNEAVALSNWWGRCN